MFGIPEHALPAVCVVKAPLDRRRLYAVIRRMAEVAGLPCPDTALLDDRGMETLQAACLGRPGPTNILSFSAPASPNRPTVPTPPTCPRYPIGPTVPAEPVFPAAPTSPMFPISPAEPTAPAEPAFPAGPVFTGPGGPAEGFRGCLALSVDTLEREAFLYGQEATAYCIRLLAHGLAHLAGCDHGPAMRELEERLERAGAAASVA